MIDFEYLNKADFCLYAQIVFDILSGNMTIIAPTGNSYEEDYKMWYSAVSGGLQKAERQIILIKDNENVVGYFQYYINEDTFMMEEIQFKPEYQGKGIFRKLYGFVLENINQEHPMQVRLCLLRGCLKNTNIRQCTDIKARSKA